MIEFLALCSVGVLCFIGFLILKVSIRAVLTKGTKKQREKNEVLEKMFLELKAEDEKREKMLQPEEEMDDSEEENEARGLESSAVMDEEDEED